MKNFVFLMLILALSNNCFSQNLSFNGKWKLIKNESSDLDHFQYIYLDISVKNNEVSITREMGSSKKYFEEETLKTDGKLQSKQITDDRFINSFFIGAKLLKGEKKEIIAKWENKNRLMIDEKFKVITSQGYKDIESINTYDLSDNKDILTLKVKRNTRKNGKELIFVFKKFDENNAYMMRFVDDWEINSKLPEQACLISIQGIVNEDKPNLYFIYGPKWDFNYTENLHNYLVNNKHFTFTELNSLEAAIRTFKDKLKGYIVWDKNIRTSLIIAYTLAGLEKSIAFALIFQAEQVIHWSII
jgi:hypothetical protein